MDLTNIFLDGLSSKTELQESIEIVQGITNGRAWLIGSSVYGTIVEQIYGVPLERVDTDFLVEDIVLEPKLPIGWKVGQNRFGTVKLVNIEDSIDLVPIGQVYSIRERRLPATLKNYLTGTPFNVQSIAFHIYEKRVIGDLGINAIHQKGVWVNDLDFANYAASKKELSLKEYLQETADKLEFTPFFSQN